VFFLQLLLLAVDKAHLPLLGALLVLAVLAVVVLVTQVTMQVDLALQDRATMEAMVLVHLETYQAQLAVAAVPERLAVTPAVALVAMAAVGLLPLLPALLLPVAVAAAAVCLAVQTTVVEDPAAVLKAVVTRRIPALEMEWRTLAAAVVAATTAAAPAVLVL